MPDAEVILSHKVNSDVFRSFMPNKSTFSKYCLTQWISKLPRSFEIQWARQYLVNVTGLAGIVNATVDTLSPRQHGRHFADDSFKRIFLNENMGISNKISLKFVHKQSSRSPKVVSLFSATNFSSYIIEFLRVHDTIEIKWNYAWIHYDIAIRSHLMI